MDKLKELLEKQGKAFEAFKEANDSRLKAVEEKGNSDPVLDQKVDKANEDIGNILKQIEDIQAKANRPNSGADSGKSQEVLDHEEAFTKFLVKGTDEGLEGLEKKALNVTTDADGGYAVPEEFDRNILSLMRDQSPMRQVCNVIQVGTSDYKKLVNLHGAGHGWVDEDDARPETDTPTLARITPFMGELYSNPAATQTMLDDSYFNAEAWLLDEVTSDFAEDEADAFLNGTGTKQPKGILQYTSATTADGVRAFGQLQHVVTAGATAISMDELIGLLYTLRKAQRNGATWMANGQTYAYLRKLKDSNGNYLWQPSTQAGQPASLLGYGVTENEDMADIATGVVSVMFGNYKRGYTIVDRMGTRTLRDPFTNKPYVHFYTTKRVGGMLVDSEAIKLLQQA